MNRHEIQINMYTPYYLADKLKEYTTRGFSSANCLSIYKDRLNEAFREQKSNKEVVFVINKIFGNKKESFELSMDELRSLYESKEGIVPNGNASLTFLHIRTDQCRKIK